MSKAISKRSTPGLIAQLATLAGQLDIAAAELASLQRHAQALEGLRRKLTESMAQAEARITAILDAAGEAGLSSAAVKRLRSAQASASAQQLRLQMAMQRENQAFSALAHVLKARHDTVKNAIGNVR